MRRYDYYLSTEHDGSQRDIYYDMLCEALLEGDGQGFVILEGERKEEVKALLEELWTVKELHRWLTKLDYNTTQYEINESNFVKLVGWMYDKCIISQSLTKRKLARYLYEVMPFERPKTESSLLVWLSMHLNNSISSKLASLDTIIFF